MAKRWFVVLLAIALTVFFVGCKEKKEGTMGLPEEMEINEDMPHSGMEGMPPGMEGMGQKMPPGMGQGMPAGMGQASGQEREIVISEEVKNKWKAVKLLIAEKDGGGYSETVTVNLHGEFAVPDSNLKIKVGDFIPHFTMGETITSKSNELEMPAVFLTVTEGNEEIFKHWIYSKMPTMHAFEHEKYSITLVDFVTAK